MPKGDKYTVLTRFLSQCGREHIRMTFSELEALCGLPSSAYRYPACWSNASETSLSYGWLLADYVVEAYDLTRQAVVFQHDPAAARDYLGRPARREQNRISYERCCRTHAAPAEAVDLLPLILSTTHFYQALLSDPHGRYRSWEYCYSAFAAHRASAGADELDYLALHLAWYLASWGMLRGSAFLLQKDYKLHIPAVELLLQERWAPLWTLSRRDLFRANFAPTAMELADALTQVYQAEAGETPSDTLLTKILLGTVGCTPAYDRYFKWAVRETRAATPTLGTQSLSELGRLYAVHWDRLEPLRQTYSLRGTPYPPMKVLDMCFFQYGLEHLDDGARTR